MPFKSILYVDDDPDICSIVRATLHLVPDLRVRTADSGERAIDLAYELRPDLVLMDVMMPGLDGPSTFKRMRASALLANTPVIFMTAKALPKEIAKFLQLGAIGVIVKPFDPLKLYDDLCALWRREDASIQRSTVADAQARVEAEVTSLTGSFLLRARSDALNLARLIKLVQAGDQSPFEEIVHVAHSIHGAAAMFGFSDVSALGGSIARAAEEFRAGGAARGSAVELLQLSEYSARLSQHIEAAWQTAPQSAAMFQGATASIRGSST
jgi:two-component system OmpR family response regulator